MLDFGYSAACRYEITWVEPPNSLSVSDPAWPALPWSSTYIHAISLIGEGQTGRVYSIQIEGTDALIAAKLVDGKKGTPTRQALEYEGHMYWKLGLKPQLRGVIPLCYGLYQHPRMAVLLLEQCGPPLHSFRELPEADRLVSIRPFPFTACRVTPIRMLGKSFIKALLYFIMQDIYTGTSVLKMCFACLAAPTFESSTSSRCVRISAGPPS
jgi:hypothetical protein